MSFYRTFVATLGMLAVSTTVLAVETNSQIPNQSTTSQKIATTSTTPQEVKVNINSATIKELMEVKGMSRIKAKNILIYRKKHGNFKSLDDLKMVKGFKKIKDENLQLIQNQLIVN